MRTPKHSLLFFATPLVALAIWIALLITPILTHWSTTTEVARWSSPTPLYGSERPVWLSVQRDVACVDIYSQYPSYQLFITDGYYAYVREFDVPSTDFKNYLARCQVAWQTNGVKFTTPDAETYFIPDQIIRARIGSD